RRAVHARRDRASGADVARKSWPFVRRRRGRIAPMTVAAATQTRPVANAALFHGEGLRKSFGGVHAVRDISLSIPRGSVFAIIGPNGAGKSTLLNLMSGLYQPDAGRMVFDGVDLIGLPVHKRVRL